MQVLKRGSPHHGQSLRWTSARLHGESPWIPGLTGTIQEERTREMGGAPKHRKLVRPQINQTFIL